MAHDSNGHIYADSTSGVRVVQDIIAVVGGLVGTKYRPFTNGNINKWSKHKPVKYASLDRLTDEEFKGERNETERGIWYGVKIANSGTGSGQKLVPSVHTDITLEYLRPIGLVPSQPHRVLDFDGYYHNAIPSPLAAWSYGDQQLVGFFDTEEGLAVSLNYGTGMPNAGIDVVGIVANDPSNVYLACVVSKGSAHYATYLRNADATNHPVTPLYFQNAWQRNFFVDFRNLPSAVIGTGYTISLILTTQTLAVPHINTTAGQWTSVPDDNIGLQNTPFACPFNTSLTLEGIGRSLNLDRLTIDPPVFRIATHPMSAQGVSINMTWDKVDTDKVGYWQAEVAYNGYEAPAKRGNFDPDGDLRTAIALVGWSEFGLVERPTTGTIRVTMRTGWTEGGYTKTNTETFSVAE